MSDKRKFRQISSGGLVVLLTEVGQWVTLTPLLYELTILVN